MTMLRDHAIFTIRATQMTRARIEDSLGELTGYTNPERTNLTVTIVAPTIEIAKAYVIGRYKHWDVEIEDVEEQKIDAFIQDHMW